MSVRSTIIDTWSALSHKRDLTATVPGPGVKVGLAPSWTGEHARRLSAYKVLESYFRNVARDHLNSLDEKTRRDHREYGDANLLVKAVVTALLGDDQTIVVDDADDSADATADQRARSKRQDWLREWADTERLRTKMLETERDAVKLGDGVYVLGWSPSKKRVRIRLYDPGCYFPVITDDDPEDEFPPKVHLAWEFTRKDFDGKELTYLRRLTWRLGPILPLADRATGLPLVTSDGQLVLREGDRLDANRGIVRKLPYATEPTSITCYWSDGTWLLGPTGNETVVDLDETKAVWRIDEEGNEVHNLDLGIDFIPVLHIPNTVAIKDHYGEALLSAVAQVLDDLAAADTDVAAATALAAVPTVALSGSSASDLTVRPGRVFNVGMNGRMDVLDLAAALPELLGIVDALQKRLSDNARVADEVLGRVKASEVASGVLFAMAFGPMRSLIGEMRMVRDEKNPLLLKFAQRWAMVAGELPAGEPMPARIDLGSFLPTDRQAVVTEVSALYAAHLVSRETALEMLEAAGIDLGDIQEELLRIESEDFENALALLEATGDEAAVFDYLHRTPPPPPTPAPAPTAILGPDGRPLPALPPANNPPPTPPTGNAPQVLPPGQ